LGLALILRRLLIVLLLITPCIVSACRWLVCTGSLSANDVNNISCFQMARTE